MAKDKSIIIIPARGGSKRLHGKNMVELAGQPLIAHSLKYALAHKQLVSDIVVTTDDETIKTFVETKGVTVVNRPEEISKDNSSTVSALKHVLQSSNKDYNTVILLQPTNPFRPRLLLKEALNTFKSNSYDSLMTVSLNDKKLGKITNGIFEPYTYKMGQRSQDLEPLYFENGLLYISKAELILNDQILGDNNFPFIVEHPYASVDIDTIEDLNYAEFILNNYSDE